MNHTSAPSPEFDWSLVVKVMSNSAEKIWEKKEKKKASQFLVTLTLSGEDLDMRRKVGLKQRDEAQSK